MRGDSELPSVVIEPGAEHRPGPRRHRVIRGIVVLVVGVLVGSAVGDFVRLHADAGKVRLLGVTAAPLAAVWPGQCGRLEAVLYNPEERPVAVSGLELNLPHGAHDPECGRTAGPSAIPATGTARWSVPFRAECGNLSDGTIEFTVDTRLDGNRDTISGRLDLASRSMSSVVLCERGESYRISWERWSNPTVSGSGAEAMLTFSGRFVNLGSGELELADLRMTGAFSVSGPDLPLTVTPEGTGAVQLAFQVVDCDRVPTLFASDLRVTAETEPWSKTSTSMDILDDSIEMTSALIRLTTVACG